MMTLFSTPKPFCSHFKIIQRNAIQSWLALYPRCEIILFGDDEGTAQICAEFGIRHIPEIACNEFGTPLLDSLFAKAQELASHRIMTYINADIILMNDFLKAIQRIELDSFLMVGQRWDLDLKDELEFNSVNWRLHLRTLVRKEGILHPHWGIDYFVFSRGLFEEVPPFAIGRPGYDSWLIYHTHTRGLPVIDASHMVMAVHQNHDYSHVKNGKNGAYKGPEAEKNKALIGGREHMFTIREGVTHILYPKGLIPSTYQEEGSLELILSGLRQGELKGLSPEKKMAILQASYNLGLLYKRKGLLDMAKKRFEAVIELSKDRGLDSNKELTDSAHFHLGTIYRTMGKRKEAEMEFKRCLNLIPDHREAKEAIIG